jgi:signal transduction histidine kinase
MTSPPPPGPGPARAAASTAPEAAGSDRRHGGRGRVDSPFRWLATHPQTVDVVIFGVCAAFSALSVITAGLAGALFSVPMFVAGMFLRSHTGPATLVIGILAVGHFALGAPGIFGDVMIFYALYCANVHGSRRVARLSLIAAFLGCAMQAGWVTVDTWDPEFSSLPGSVATFIGLFLAGSMVLLGIWAVARYQRVRVEQLDMAREQAAQAVREREQRTQLAVADERSRIAREMHDVVAHSLSVIIAQADGGRFVASQHPEKAADVLETIGSTGRAALADMRSLLGVLRGDEDTSFGPQPGLDALDDLVARVDAAGLKVSLEREGDLHSIPQAVSMSSFRLVQEALTNVMKHAGPAASARVEVRRTHAGLAIDVLDDGRGHDPSSDGQGHGLTGMRERVAVFGGELDAGPLPDGGFRVGARIPLSGTPSPYPPAQQTAHRTTHTPTPTPPPSDGRMSS